MIFKIILLLACFAATNAGYIQHPYVHSSTLGHHYNHHDHHDHHDSYDPHPEYKFSYGVDDHITGDSKSQYEERNGDVVKGEYSLIDADGFKRIVKYTSDPHNGFQAVVHREPLLHHVKTFVPLKQYSHGHNAYSYYHY